MNIALHLEDLKVKKTPIHHKTGFKVKIVKPAILKQKDEELILSENVDVKKTDDKKVEDYSEPYEKIPLTQIKIVDGRNKKKIDRDLILARIHKKQVSPVLEATAKLASPFDEEKSKRPANEIGEEVAKEVAKEMTEELANEIEKEVATEVDEDSLFRVEAIPKAIIQNVLELIRLGAG